MGKPIAVECQEKNNKRTESEQIIDLGQKRHIIAKHLNI